MISLNYFIFWTCTFLLVYIYLLYPLIIKLAAEFSKRKKKGIKVESIIGAWPSVSLIISAYNEVKTIERKIENTFELCYPGSLEIIVVSDGSTDGTVEIVRRYASRGIKLLELYPNQGKTVAQNRAVEVATGDILVFSDANAIYEPNAICELVKGFSEPDIGCVCGELCYVDENGVQSQEGVYWRYERVIKKAESDVWSTIGANGSIYAVRRELYQPLPPEAISDFVEPLFLLRNGYRTIYVAQARSFEEIPKTSSDDFKRKVRIVNRSCRGLLWVKELLNPFKYPYASIMLFSHKVLRWSAGVWSLGVLVSNVFIIDRGFYGFTFAFQGFFYLLVLVGYLVPGIRSRVVTIPLYFFTVNLAGILGIWSFLCGKKIIGWQPLR
ncbi:hypothetical protein SY88_00090 [Clostridiales bacterium PH28_bin88]|nr:hypothetical protein SY88_00090 [Clostridiales bacterium PH28_bin88]